MNMKNYIYTFLLLLFTSLVGCTKDDTLNGDFQDVNLSLNVSFSGLDNINVKEGDKLSLYKKGGNKVADLLFVSSDEGVYTFSVDAKQTVNPEDEFTAVFPAMESPVYDSSVGVLKCEQNGSGSVEHLTSMGRFEADFTFEDNKVVTLNNKLSVVSLDIVKPGGEVKGLPVELEFNVTDESADNASVYSKSVVSLVGLTDWDGLKINLMSLPKSENVNRNISCVIVTSLNEHYIQELMQDGTVKYGAGENVTINLNDLQYSEPVFVDPAQTVTITDNVKQKIYIGLDAERLWYWRDNLRDELAQLSVGDINVKFARVAIDCGYELEEGIKKPEVYDIQLNMMRAFKAVRPDLLFFATPRPLFNSYTEEERVELFGHVDNTPWSSVPLWACNFKQSGNTTMPDGTVVPNYVYDKYDKDKLVSYFADYLNFMHDNGFDFEYMDLTNETETRTTPDIYKYVYDNLPAKLNAGVKMPTLIAPSSWSVQGGINWMKTVTDDEKDAFGIAAVHNTGNQGGTLKQFVNLATQMDKPAWNTELHDWVGIATEDEVLTADSFFEYFRAGFTGMSGWLFFGPANGKDHSKLWVGSTPGSHTKSAKYEIFKTVVNGVNDGNYIESVVSTSIPEITTTSFVKDKMLMIAVLNTSTDSRVVTYDLGNKIIDGQISVKEWNGDLPKSGEEFTLVPTTSSKFQFALGAKSLYIFTVNLTESLQ